MHEKALSPVFLLSISPSPGGLWLREIRDICDACSSPSSFSSFLEISLEYEKGKGVMIN